MKVVCSRGGITYNRFNCIIVYKNSVWNDGIQTYSMTVIKQF